MKGLLDDVNAFDVEMSRLSVDGLILVARDGKHCPCLFSLFHSPNITFPVLSLVPSAVGYCPYRCAPSRYHSTSNTPNLHHQPNLKTKPHNDNSNTRRINTQHITHNNSPSIPRNNQPLPPRRPRSRRLLPPLPQLYIRRNVHIFIQIRYRRLFLKRYRYLPRSGSTHGDD